MADQMATLQAVIDDALLHFEGSGDAIPIEGPITIVRPLRLKKKTTAPRYHSNANSKRDEEGLSGSLNYQSNLFEALFRICEQPVVDSLEVDNIRSESERSESEKTEEEKEDEQEVGSSAGPHSDLFKTLFMHCTHPVSENINVDNILLDESIGLRSERNEEADEEKGSDLSSHVYSLRRVCPWTLAGQECSEGSDCKLPQPCPELRSSDVCKKDLCMCVHVYPSCKACVGATGDLYRRPCDPAPDDEYHRDLDERKRLWAERWDRCNLSESSSESSSEALSEDSLEQKSR